MSQPERRAEDRIARRGPPHESRRPGDAERDARGSSASLGRVRDLLSIADAIAIEAAALARTRRAEGVRVAASKTDIVDIVTDADREVERLVVERILDARPDDGILGEEGTTVAGTSGTTWVIDPIDGTVNYFYGIPVYAVSIGIVEGDPDPSTWEGLAGVVVNAATGEHFRGIAGEGSTCDGVRLRVNEPVPLELALVGTGFGYLPERRKAQGAAFAQILPHVRDARRIGSAALDIAGVGAGRVDIFFERGLNPWDHCAGAIIAREAGAEVRGHEGRESSGFLAAGHPAMLDAIWPIFEEAEPWE